MRNRFLERRSAHRAVASPHTVITGGTSQSGLAEMTSQQFRLVRRQFGEALFERASGPFVPVAPAAQQQTLIG